MKIRKVMRRWKERAKSNEKTNENIENVIKE